MPEGVSPDSTSHTSVPQISLAALFVTALITAQVIASKVVALALPLPIPVIGEQLIVPAAVFAYALTFFASDCYTELYGQRAGHVLVNVAFAMNFVLLALVWLAIAAPTFARSPVAGDTFAQVLGPSTAIVAGSLAAYIVSQNWDVFVFQSIRDATDGDYLWLRNIASTTTSQLIDTVIFISIAFVLLQDVPISVAVGLAFGQYLVKLLIAALDTPFVYMVVSLVGPRPTGQVASETE